MSVTSGRSNLRGINYNPGNTSFTPDRHLLRLGGALSRVPDFRNRCGEGVIVHGGGRQMMTGGGMEGPTIVEDDVTLAARAVVFRSRIGRGSTVGVKSAVVSSDLAPGTVIPDRVIYLNDAILGPVEW